MAEEGSDPHGGDIFFSLQELPKLFPRTSEEGPRKSEEGPRKSEEGPRKSEAGPRASFNIDSRKSLDLNIDILTNNQDSKSRSTLRLLFFCLGCCASLLLSCIGVLFRDTAKVVFYVLALIILVLFALLDAFAAFTYPLQRDAVVGKIDTSKIHQH